MAPDTENCTGSVPVNAVQLPSAETTAQQVEQQLRSTLNQPTDAVWDAAQLAALECWWQPNQPTATEQQHLTLWNQYFDALAVIAGGKAKLYFANDGLRRTLLKRVEERTEDSSNNTKSAPATKGKQRKRGKRAKNQPQQTATWQSHGEAQWKAVFKQRTRPGALAAKCFYGRLWDAEPGQWIALKTKSIQTTVARKQGVEAKPERQTVTDNVKRLETMGLIEYLDQAQQKERFGQARADRCSIARLTEAARSGTWTLPSPEGKTDEFPQVNPSGDVTNTGKSESLKSTPAQSIPTKSPEGKNDEIPQVLHTSFRGIHYKPPTSSGGGLAAPSSAVVNQQEQDQAENQLEDLVTQPEQTNTNTSSNGMGLSVEPSPSGEPADAGEPARPSNTQKTASEGLTAAKTEQCPADDYWDVLEELVDVPENEPEVVCEPLFPFGSDLYIKIVQNSAPSLGRMCSVEELQQFNNSRPVDHLLIKTIVGVEKTVPAASASAR